MEFFRAGIVASTIVNVSPNRKPGAKASTPRDFMPKMGRQSKAEGLDPKRVRADLLSAFGDRVRKKERGGGG